MKNIEFEVLRLIDEGCNEIDKIASSLFKSVEQVNCALKNLARQGFLINNTLTQRGGVFLRQHRVDNAIILAAGLSSRFVPLNFEEPKGLIKVHGEALIERQIKQLKARGIDEIVIVVGYMKEAFYYLKEKYGVILVEATDFRERNNHASIYAAREYLKNSIITSSDLYFSENIFQKYAFDSFYCTTKVCGKTAERGIETNDDDRILKTFYGDKCYDVWVTLGYAFFSREFSKRITRLIKDHYLTKEYANLFWADIQDRHLEELYMYAKRCPDDIIHEFDSLEELRTFDSKYINNSGSKILSKIAKALNVQEKELVGFESLKKIKESLFKFSCGGNVYICDVKPDGLNKIHYAGKDFYLCTDVKAKNLSLYIMDSTQQKQNDLQTDIEIDKLYFFAKEFREYHERALPLCAAENVISPFANLPLTFGFQERYIMNNTYSFNMDDNFIGCEKLFPFYQMLSDVCSRIFGAKYTDARPFTGMHCIDMIVKTVCKPGDKMMILDSEFGGHASVKPVVERLGVKVYPAPYDIDNYDLDYDAVNELIKKEKINSILLAPSDLIKPLAVEKIDTENCVLLWDCSQLMGLIAAGRCNNPLKTTKNMIMFGGTHKTLPGPASGLILTNDDHLHELMETEINPKYLRHSQMHQKISLLFSLIEFEHYGKDYIDHVVYCSNYLGERLKKLGFDVALYKGKVSLTHQIFIRCSKEMMDTIYDNAYKCEVTLNKKRKALFSGYGIRLGTQEIARYGWGKDALDTIAQIIKNLSEKDIDLESTRALIKTLPPKDIKFAFPTEVVEKFKKLIEKD